MKNAVKILALALLFNFITSCTADEIEQDPNKENIIHKNTDSTQSNSDDGEDDDKPVKERG